MNSNYLEINGIQFGDSIFESGYNFNLSPSSVVPSTEIIKTTERSLSGKMSVDITAIKRQLKVTFDLLTDDAYNYVSEILNLKDLQTIDADGLELTYFDFIGKQSKVTIKCYVDAMTAIPYIIDEEIMWKNVELTFVEI